MSVNVTDSHQDVTNAHLTTAVVMYKKWTGAVEA